MSDAAILHQAMPHKLRDSLFVPECAHTGLRFLEEEICYYALLASCEMPDKSGPHETFD